MNRPFCFVVCLLILGIYCSGQRMHVRDNFELLQNCGDSELSIYQTPVLELNESQDSIVLSTSLDSLEIWWFYNRLELTDYNGLKKIPLDNNGTYQAMIRTRENCRFLSNLLVVDFILSSKKPQMGRVYPNQTSSLIYLSGWPANYMVSVYNTQGQVLLNPVTTDLLDLSKFSPGLYFVKVQTSEESKVFRIIRGE